MVEIRPENIATDLEAIRAVTERAFRKTGGSSAYEHVRGRDDVVGLVAVDHRQIVGHVLFTPVRLEDVDEPLEGMGLLLLAVDPGWQGQGIGDRLTRAGIERLRARSCPFAIVIGLADYYPRFGFVPGSRLGLECQWKGIDDASFMVLMLDQAAVAGRTGVARYVDRFE